MTSSAATAEGQVRREASVVVYGQYAMLRGAVLQ
jgi:hypothetical protein